MLEEAGHRPRRKSGTGRAGRRTQEGTLHGRAGRALRRRGPRRRPRRLCRRHPSRPAGQAGGGRGGEVLGRRLSERGLHPQQGPAAQRRTGAHLHPRGEDLRHPGGRTGHLRLRRGLPPQPQGRRRPGQGRPLPDEEKQDHRDRRPRHLPRPAHPPGGRLRRQHPHHRLRQLHHRHRRRAQAAPRHPAQRARGDLRGADPGRGAAALDRHRGRRRHRRRVRIRPSQLRCEGHHRRVPGPHGPAGGRRGLRRTRQAVPPAGHRRADLDAGRHGRRVRRDGARHGHRQGRHPAGPGGRQGTPGDRLPAEHRGLWPGQDRRDRHRTRRDRHRRPLPYLRPAHLRHRRCHGEADARARRRGDGHRRRRDHCGRRDDGAGLCDDPAGHLLPAADRQLRLDRGAGPRAWLRREGGEVPVHGERQVARPR